MATIELVGPSCAGKSTLLRRLELELREQGQAVRALNGRRAATVGDLLRAVRDPGIRTWCALNPLMATGARTRQVLGAVGLVRRTRPRAGILLLDEGPVRLYLRLRSRTSRRGALLSGGIPRPDLLILVTCHPTVRLARLRQADRRHARVLSDVAILDRGREDSFVRRFAAERGVPVMEIDTSPGSDDPETLAPALRTWLAGQSGPAWARPAATAA